MRDKKGRFVKGHKIPKEWKKIISTSNKLRNTSIKTKKLRSESLKKCHAEGRHRKEEIKLMKQIKGIGVTS